MAKLNDLDGKTWVLNTKSWFILRGKARGKNVINHPAKFPEELAKKFISFFSKRDDIIFDPFMGVGSSAVAAQDLNREFYGIEINNDFCSIIYERTMCDNVVCGDSRLFKNYLVKDVDFILTSPPYWNMLKKKRGHSYSQHSQREENDLQLYYSDLKDDLGNIDDYDKFLEQLKKVFENCYKVLKKSKYMVVVVQNFRNDTGEYVSLAWDLANVIQQCGFTFEGEQIWCQDDKQLGIWGYPSKFISNVHHHYCLVFRKNA